VKGKDGHITLMQSKTNTTKPKVDNSLKNFKNMGYEGTFWFGEPSQEI